MTYVCPHLLQSKPVPGAPGEKTTVKEDDTIIMTNTCYPPLDSLHDIPCARVLEFTIPTPVQKYAIPVLLNKNPLMVRAPTGMGKTFCFLLPLIEGIAYTGSGIQICIITPTRELTLQIQKEAQKIVAKKHVRVDSAYGSQGAHVDYKLTDILVATPGRLLDYLKSGKIMLNKADYFVLDEADKLLSMGFDKDILAIKKYVPSEVKVCLFSATFHRKLEDIIDAFLPKNHFVVEVQNETVATIKQRIIEVSGRDRDTKKDEFLKGLLSQMDFSVSWKKKKEADKVIVFVERKTTTQELERRIAAMGFKCASLSGDKEQRSRVEILNNFTRGYTPILVATSVIARGIDVKDVKLVVNYDFPQETKEYIHRIGRTGREGKEGMAVSFISPSALSTDMASDIVKILKESGNEVPAFLLNVRDSQRHGGDSYKHGGDSQRDSQRHGGGARKPTLSKSFSALSVATQKEERPATEAITEKEDSEDELPGQW